MLLLCSERRIAKRLIVFVSTFPVRPIEVIVIAANGVAKDYENLNRTAIAFIRLASIRLMLRRLTRYCYPS